MGGGSLGLLPKSHADFDKKEYWNEFFTTRGQEAFEWYGEYQDLKPILDLQTVRKNKQRVLIIGCGNSNMSFEMAQDGYEDLVNIDFSEKVIDEMTQKHPHMNWKVMDMTNMIDLEDKSFDLVIDKGALDALMAQDTDEVRLRATRMFSEIQRILNHQGQYVCVTMAQDFILSHLLSAFVVESKHWNVFMDQVPRRSQPTSSTMKLSPFVMIATQVPANMLPTWVQFHDVKANHETCSHPKTWLIQHIEASQWYSVSHRSLQKLQVGRLEKIELFSSCTSNIDAARYILTIVDASMSGLNGKCGVFLIPQGREHEWIFSSEEGLHQLATGAGFARLIVVALGRGHAFQSIEQVQTELNAKMLELAPEGMNVEKNDKMPYLTVPDGIGRRTVVHEGCSKWSGPYWVEDVACENGECDAFYRRLIFKSNVHVIQSEVKVLKKGTNGTNGKNGKNGKKSKKTGSKRTERRCTKDQRFVDPSFVSFAYHKGMVAGLLAFQECNKQSFMKKEVQMEVKMEEALEAMPSRSMMLVIGLGGGALPMYLANHFPSSLITTCELDEAIVQVAESYFGFQSTEKNRVIVADGLVYLANMANSLTFMTYDAILIDVDAKDSSVGMSCPPEAFVETDFLQNVHKCLSPNGILVINMSARSETLLVNTLSKLERVFMNQEIFQLQASEEDVNRVIFLRKSPTPNKVALTYRKGLIKHHFKQLSSTSTSNSSLHLNSVEEEQDFLDLVSQLQLIPVKSTDS